MFGSILYDAISLELVVVVEHGSIEPGFVRLEQYKAPMRVDLAPETSFAHDIFWPPEHYARQYAVLMLATTLYSEQRLLAREKPEDEDFVERHYHSLSALLAAYEVVLTVPKNERGQDEKYYEVYYRTRA